MKQYREGLVVGKFSPLHKGHQSLIDKALSMCDRVYVINYSNPPFPRCDAEERAHWFSVLYPQVTYIGGAGLDKNAPPNDAYDEDHRRYCAATLLHRNGATVDAVFTSEGYGEGFAEYLTKWFSKRMGHPHPVDHVMHDEYRMAIPTSGTRVRAYRDHQDMYLDPVVRASMIPRIAFLGGESSGKTTLTQMLAQRYGPSARYVPEYGRLYGDHVNNNFRFSDMEHIATQQVALERAPVSDARIQLCDTTPLVTLWYSYAWYNYATSHLQQLALRKYDLTILCVPPYEYEDDGTRSGPEFRQRGYEMQRNWLIDSKQPFVEVTGDKNTRFLTVVREINERGFLL